MANDLEYLAAEAFEFTLDINPEAGCYVPVADVIKERHIDDDDWLSLEQRDEAVRTNKICIGRVYPNGSVSFFRVAGTDVMAVVARCAELCRSDRARYLKAKGGS